MKLIQAFLEYLSFEKKYSDNTIISYKNDLENFLNFIEKTYEIKGLQNIHYNQIRTWIVLLVSENISNRSINRKMSSLKSFYKFLIKTKQIKENPLQKHKSLKVPKRVNVPFNKKEINEVLFNLEQEKGFIAQRNRLMIELFYGTGMRRNELINLRIQDIDIEQKTIKVLGKRNKERYIPMLKTIQNTLVDYMTLRREKEQSSEYLFVTKKGNKLYGTLVYRVINDYFSSVSSKVKKSPHVLRHAFATHLLDEGADLNSVKELLGHASLASTQVYTNSSLKELKYIYNQAHPRSSTKN